MGCLLFVYSLRFVLTLRNNAASSLSERDIGMHTDSDDDLDEMQLELA